MKLSIPNFPRLGGAVIALRQMRWRDPLMQVWGLMGGLFLLGIFGHYVWSAGSGEKKKEGSAILFATAKNWGTAWQPDVPFSAGKSPIEIDSVPISELDFRALASSAAGKLGWHYLSPAVRQQIASLRNQISRISITWSGTAGGNAAALEFYHVNILGEYRGSPGDFIIGNGRRGGDGRIETSRNRLASETLTSPEIIVCLVGETQLPTSAQKAALGELITALEARSGRAELGTHKARTRSQLAGLD